MDAAEGLPGKDIAEKAGLSYQTVRRYLGAMQEAGLVVRDGRGKNTVWRVAEDEGEDGRKKGGRRKA
jgi:DNA-binding IclR family transcriptional regulator